MSLTRDDLAKLCPYPKGNAKGSVWDFYVDGIIDNQDLFARYGITTRNRWVHLLAQWSHESGGFTILWESGAYSAARIMQIFGVGRHSAAVTQAEANRIASLRGEARAKALFERVYGSGNPRKSRELGNKDDGDGYAFRGCGIVQITGRAAHEKYYCGDYSARNIIEAALKEWKSKGCSRWADEDNIRKITRLINGGYNGLSDREQYLAKAKRIWADVPSWSGEVATHEDDPAVEEDQAVDDGPLPGPDLSIKDLAKVSRKAWLVNIIRRWAARLGIGAGGVGVTQLVDPDGPASPIVTFLQANALWLLLGCILTAIVTASALLIWMQEDVASGRAIPSKET